MNGKGRPNDLTPDDLVQIRLLWRNGDGLSIAALSRCYAVSRYVIDRIITQHIEYLPTAFTTDARK